MARGAAEAAAQGADLVELRLDLLDRPPSPPRVASLIEACPLPAIVTLRPTRQGGRYNGDEAERLALLQHALDAGAAWIDVEDDVPAERRPRGAVILSHHDFGGCPADLDAIVDAMEASDAAVNKVAFAAAGPDEALRAFDVLRRCRKPTIALAMGEEGLLSRIAAPKFGAFGTFAALAAGAESAPGQPTIDQLRGLYRWDSIGPGTTLYGVIGCPVGHSMSPAIHNAAIEAAGLDGLYVPLLVHPDEECFRRLLDGIRRRTWLDWRGLSVTIPHKEHALRAVGAAGCDPLAVTIGAVNTISLEPDGSLRGDNTDYAAAIDSLCGALEIERPHLAGRKVAVLGAGGVSRAIAAGLADCGARVTVYNRTRARAEELAGDFGARGGDLADAPGDAEVVINGTSVGMHPRADATPLPNLPSTVRLVFDTIYNPIQTRLLTEARAAGAAVLTGVDMFVAQGAAQFERWTGQAAPRDIMRAVIVERLRR